MRSKLGSVSVEKDQLTGEVEALKLEVISKKGSKIKTDFFTIAKLLSYQITGFEIIVYIQ